MARRNDHSRDELSRMALLAAEKILTEEGPGKLSTRKVAQAIGYSVGTLYQLFRDLDDLVEQLNARTLIDMQKAMQQGLADQPDARARVRQMAYNYLEFAQRHPARWKLLFEYQRRRAPELGNPYTQLIEGNFRQVEEALGQQGRDKRLLARTLWASVHGVTSLEMNYTLQITGAGSARALLAFLVEEMVAD